MSIKTYHLYESGSIPGQEGIFAAGQSVSIDEDTNQIVGRMLIVSMPDQQLPDQQPPVTDPPPPTENGGAS